MAARNVRHAMLACAYNQDASNHRAMRTPHVARPRLRLAEERASCPSGAYHIHDRLRGDR